jgi:hypothetical protein
MFDRNVTLILRSMAENEEREWTAEELAQKVNITEDDVLDVMLYLSVPQVVFTSGLGIPLPSLTAPVTQCLKDPTRFVLDVNRARAFGLATAIETRN